MDFFSPDPISAHITHFKLRVFPTKEFSCRQLLNPISRALALLGRVGIFAQTRCLHRFSAFWLRSKCSICSYQLNIWYKGHVPFSILNLFLQGMECQELAPVLSRVDLALQYRKDWPTPITTQNFWNSLAMLTLGGVGYGFSTLNQDIHGNISTYIERQTVLQRLHNCTHQWWVCAHEHVAIYYKHSSNQNFSQWKSSKNSRQNQSF